MPKIPEDIIKSILDRADIVEVVSDFLNLRKTGVRYTAICPFHDDTRDGNFIVYPKGNCFKCFACDKKGGPVDFLMEYAKLSFPDAIRWLGRKYNIETDDVPFNYTPPPPRPKPEPLPMLILPMTLTTIRGRVENDPLCRWLLSLPWDGAQRKRNAIGEYAVGHAKTGHTIFWQIDEQMRLRTGKMMLYKADGHRDRETRYNFDWIHSALFRDQRFPQWSDEKQECKPTFFGMHLLNKYPKASVNIVESEKTALIMAYAYGNRPDSIWMACGGAENLNREKLAPIMEQNRRIILYPDRDAIDKWRAKAENLRYDRLTINVQAVIDWWRPEDGDKADIADVVVRMMLERTKPIVSVGDLMTKNPAVKNLVARFNCDEYETDK